MSNNHHMQHVIAELTRQRDAINRALDSLLALGGTAEDAVPVPVPASSFSCPAHENNRTEFSKKGVCKLCQSERMKTYWSDRRKPAPAAEPAAPKPTRQIELVYSKKQRCPKCGLTTRFQR